MVMRIFNDLTDEDIMINHSIIWVDEWCTKETCLKDERGKPVHLGTLRKQKNLITDQVYCTACKKEEMERTFVVTESKKQEDAFGDEAEKYKFFKRYSIVSDQELIDKSKGIKDYEADTDELKTNKQLAIDAVLKIVGGSPLNVLISGDTGVGKSHLAYAMANNVNEMCRMEGRAIRVVYFNYKKIYNMITDSFDNKEMKGRGYFIKIAESAQCLVLDDVGSELKKDSTYSSDLLTEILDARADKQTIITSNLNLESLKAIYDKRFTSRLSRYFYPISFVTKDDYRAKQREKQIM